MAIIAKQKENDYKQCPVGTHVARCYRMVELGTITEKFGDEVKHRFKIWLDFETPLETMEASDGEEKPYSVSKEFAKTLFKNKTTGKKSDLLAAMEAWRGKDYTPEEVKAGIDVSKLAGQPCMITVSHNDGGYAKVTNVSKITKGLTCPPAFNKIQVLSFDSWDEDLFNSLPTFIQDKIKSSPEYQEMKGGKGNSGIEEAQVIDNDGGDLPF